MVMPNGDRVRTAAVVGLGTMGRGIVRVLASRGYRVRCFDPLISEAARTVISSLDGVSVSASLAECVIDAEIVYEAVFEELAVKKALLIELSSATSATSAIIASNTSTFLPSVLARFVSEPERLLVVHFFNPADVVPLVEIVPHPATGAAIVERLTAVMKDLGKRPVVVREERVGFVANRLQAAILREGLSLVEQGVIEPADLDEIVKSGLAPRWALAGPVGVADLGGLDIFQALCAQVFPSLDASVTASKVLTDLVSDGDLGVKTGSGFYSYSEMSTEWMMASMRKLFTVVAELRGADPG